MTARQEAEAQLRRLSFSGIAEHLQLRVVVDEGPVSRSRPVRCLARMVFPDTCVREGSPPPFPTETAFHLTWGDDTSTVASLVTALQDRLLHEFAESVWLDGERLLDPHGREGRSAGWDRFRRSV